MWMSRSAAELVDTQLSPPIKKRRCRHRRIVEPGAMSMLLLDLEQLMIEPRLHVRGLCLQSLVIWVHSFARRVTHVVRWLMMLIEWIRMAGPGIESRVARLVMDWRAACRAESLWRRE